MIRIYLAVGLLAMRLSLGAHPQRKRSYVGRHHVTLAVA